MAACIVVGCSCSSFAAKPNCKGSLIGYSRGCETCGHLMKEHREMSTVELHVQREITTAGSTRCSCVIPFGDVHRSPVFGPYVPIKVPYDESLNGEAGVECPCKGFQVENMLSIFDKFSRTSMTEVLELLPAVSCQICGHLLMHHQSKPVQGSGPPYHSMSLTTNCYAQLPFPVVRTVGGGCVLLCNPQKAISLVAMAITDHGLSAVIIRKTFLNFEKQGLERRLSDSVGRVEDVEIDASLKAKRHKAHHGSTPSRKSVRLAEKMAKKETSSTIESNSTDLNGNVTTFHSESKEIVTEFIKSLQCIDNYFSWTLPESINVCETKDPTTILSMAAVWGRDPSNGDEGLFLTMATTNKTLNICFLSIAMKSVKYFTELPSGTENIQCMCFWETAQSLDLPDVPLCTGGSEGSVIVWHLWFQQEEPERVQFTQVTFEKHSVDSITACSFSHDGCKLAAGTERGDIIVYLLEGKPVEKSLVNPPHVNPPHILNCSRSEVTCLSWSGDDRLLGVGGANDQHIGVGGADDQRIYGCRLLGVGGADDCVQVVSVDEAIPAKAQSSCSLFKYFLPIHPIKLHQTHVLKGHVSFVSGISFFSHHLVSVGLDGQVLFWDIQQAHEQDKMYIEEVEPLCGFKLGASSQYDVLPTSIIGVGPSEILLLLQEQKSRVTVVHYSSTFRL